MSNRRKKFRRRRFRGSGFSPLNYSPTLWCRHNQGITIDTGVSQWNDQSGNGNHLVQATAAAQPALQSDGSILFDGADDYLKATFTLNQPETFVLLLKQVTWTSTDYLFDGGTINTASCRQFSASPILRVYAGTDSGSNSDLAVDTYGVIVAVFNGASSSFQINNNTSLNGNYGAANAGGFTLGANGSNAAWGNIQVKELALFPSALDATQRQNMINWMASVGKLSI